MRRKSLNITASENATADGPGSMANTSGQHRGWLVKLKISDKITLGAAVVGAVIALAAWQYPNDPKSKAAHQPRFDSTTVTAPTRTPAETSTSTNTAQPSSSGGAFSKPDSWSVWSESDEPVTSSGCEAPVDFTPFSDAQDGKRYALVVATTKADLPDVWWVQDYWKNTPNSRLHELDSVPIGDGSEAPGTIFYAGVFAVPKTVKPGPYPQTNPPSEWILATPLIKLRLGQDRHPCL